jgi:hypothetical protein
MTTEHKLTELAERCTGLGYIEGISKAIASGYAPPALNDFQIDVIDFLYDLIKIKTTREALDWMTLPISVERSRTLQTLLEQNRTENSQRPLLSFRPRFPMNICFHEFVSDEVANFLSSELIDGIRYVSEKRATWVPPPVDPWHLETKTWLNSASLPDLYEGGGLPLVRLLTQSAYYHYEDCVAQGGDVPLLRYVLAIADSDMGRIKRDHIAKGIIKQLRRGELNETVLDVLLERGFRLGQKDYLIDSTMELVKCETEFLAVSKYFHERGVHHTRQMIYHCIENTYVEGLQYISQEEHGLKMAEFSRIVFERQTEPWLLWFLDRFHITPTAFADLARDHFIQRFFSWDMIVMLLRRLGTVPLRIVDPEQWLDMLQSELWRPEPPLTTSEVLWQNYHAESRCRYVAMYKRKCFADMVNTCTPCDVKRILMLPQLLKSAS